MKLIYSVLFVSLAAEISSQNELPSGQIEVVKDFEVRLMETQKIRIIPAPVAIDSTVRRYEYRLLAPSPSIDYVVPELKPLAIDPEKKPAYYSFYAKAGFGSPNSLLGILSYDHLQSEVFDWGFDFRHLSANHKKIPLQKFSDSQGRLNGSYQLTESVQLEGYIDGHFENIYFYGADDIPANPDALKRSFNRYDANFNLSNVMDEQSSFKYMALINYLFDKDDLGAKEKGLRIGGEIASLMGEQAYPLGIKIIADLSTLRDTREQSVNNILVDPFFDYQTGNLKIHLGGTVLLKKNQNEILPGIGLSYLLFDNMVTLRAGWQGNVIKNNFRTLSTYNPYINTRLDSLGNMISRKIYAGFNGTSGNFKYEVTGHYTTFESMAFFLQDPVDEEQFILIYDDGSFFGVDGSLQFEVLKNVALRGNAYTRFYSLDNEEKPWHRPSTGIDAQATYTGGDDIYHVSLIFHGENGLPYRTVGDTETRLDPLLDLNLHGDYYITSSLGAFAEINNVFGNKRERWVNYPSFGFNAKLGILLRI